MAHAWLDSLSEDWVSEPRSENSQLHLSSFGRSQHQNSRPTSSRENVSKIPRFNHPSRKSQLAAGDVLSERSLSNANIPMARQPSSKDDILQSSQRGRIASRSLSASTAPDSVLHSTVHHKSLSASPTKDRDSVPEWKRRLLYGERAYGEAKDLFSSAGTGLENIFQPPPPPDAEQPDDNGHALHDTTLPSSPPPYMRSRSKKPVIEDSFEESSQDFSEIRPAAQKKEVKFRRNDDTDPDVTEPDGPSFEQSDQQGTATQDQSGGSLRSDSMNPLSDASRKISGKSDIYNEDFSPILLTLHNKEDGRLSFTPVELPADQLSQRLDKLRQNSVFVDSMPDSQNGLRAVAGDETRNMDTTEDFARQGGFLNLKRGGRSAEDSFRHRPLSPPMPTDSSEMLPESSLQASTPKRFPSTTRTGIPMVKFDRASSMSPDVPPAPHPSPEKQSQRSQGTTGSPLKLFGPYDTFTNQTLLRRISQFEDLMTESPSRSPDHSAQVPRPESPTKSEINREFVDTSSSDKAAKANDVPASSKGAISRFGAGELDDYVFSEDISLQPSEGSMLADKENVAPDGAATSRYRPPRLNIAYQASLPEDDSLKVRRRRDKSSTLASSYRHLTNRTISRPQTSSGADSMVNTTLLTPMRDISEGKRPRTSPSKDPTPKRRRTLHRSDIAYGLEDLPAAIEVVQSSHYQMQTGIDRKRKEIRQGRLQEVANATDVDDRQVFRPRTPTPSQRSSIQRDRQPLADIDGVNTIGLEDVSIEGSGILMRDFAYDASRQASMKTQDFLDEAERIMGMIRSRARPPTTGLSSVEESEVDDGLDQRSPDNSVSRQEDSFEESFEEPFLRPPSRDGRPVLRVPTRQEDPELADKLRQYEEVSDMGDLISYSMRSMGLAKEAIHEANKINASVKESIRLSETRHSPMDDEEVISDLPNIRLSRNPDAPTAGELGPVPSHGSHSSSASSGRSVPTGSSHNSDSRRLIAPDAVSQLIGDQVGNMVLDKDKNKWTKVKTLRPPVRGINILPSEDSEEDPFASIPDLSVDVHKEKQSLGLKTAPLEDLQEYVKEDFPHPPSSGKKSFVTEQSIDVKSILSHTKETLTRLKETIAETADETDGEIEHEITIHEDRTQKSSPSRRRNLTITFSSPVASIIQDVLPPYSEGESTPADVSISEKSVGDIAADSLRRGRNITVERSFSTRSNQSRSRSRSKSTVRSFSTKGPAFIPRPVSRIDEQDEDAVPEVSTADHRQLSIRGDNSVVASDEENRRRTSVSFVITTPAPARYASRPSATPIIAERVGTLSLSPLSEFTMNHGDQSCALEVSYVVGDNYLITGDGQKRVMSHAIRSLVEKITEVEPFEPDWDAMQVLDINDKQLKSLHKLDEFCGSVVTLDASNNCITHLDGVPESVRNLRFTHNQLSDLTAWGHLRNLQYVDISNNQINSLYVFKELVHLRNLRADGNQITSLDGIKFHDSLQILRIRDNLIEDVDFDGTRLHRLTELDLKSNQIKSIENVEQIPCLTTLNLENNRLTSFNTTGSQKMASLRYLKLSDNMITELDLASFPSIRLLHADRNHLGKLEGCSRARRLDSLSLREQRGASPLDISFLASAYEVRKLFLSGNLLTAFDPKVDFLNLQYLELANCGLQAFDKDLGQLMPNLRTLNLNFNAIEDLSALRYIPRLKKLFVAGNRVTDTSALADLLAEFPHLNRLDLRDNPSTLGFYPPVQTLVPLKQEAEVDPFILPDGSQDRDDTFAKRLDVGTKLRRRFYEIITSRRCGRLKVLDGLVINRSQIRRKDSVWQALLDSGAIAQVVPELGKEGDKET